MKSAAEIDAFAERRLVREAGTGNRESFALLYEKYVRRVYEFIHHKTFHRETAQDLTQTVFLKALAGIGKLTDADGSFAAWIFAIARNSVTDHFRTRHPRLDMEDVWDLPASGNQEIDECNRERYAALHDCLNRLAAEKRELLLLRVWENMPFAEIALLQGVSAGACKMAFYRLLGQIRKEMPALFLLLLFFK